MRVQTVSYRDPEAAFKFTQSLRETGFAVLADHPISHQLIESTYGEWEKFFASEQKHSYRFNQENQSGYFPFRTEKAKNYTVLATLKSSFITTRENGIAAKHARVHAFALQAALLPGS